MARATLGWVIAALSVGVGLSAPVPKQKEKTTPFIQWHVKEDFVSNYPNNPLVVKDKVIVGTDKGDLRAYRCKDGKRDWIHSHGARIYHRPSSDGERVYFSSENGLTAVAIKDGAKKWGLARAACDGPTLALAKHGLVYVGGHDGKLYAVDAKTGKERWALDFLADAPPDPPGFPGGRGARRAHQGQTERADERRRDPVPQRLRPIAARRRRRGHRQATLVVPGEGVDLRRRSRHGQARVHREQGQVPLLSGEEDREEGLELRDGRAGRIRRGGG